MYMYMYDWSVNLSAHMPRGSSDNCHKNIGPPKMIPPGPYISKYLGPLKLIFQSQVEIFGPLLKLMFPLGLGVLNVLELKYLDTPPPFSQRQD